MKINLRPTTKNPWKKLSSKVVYRDPWMVVKVDRVIKPDGREGKYGVVRLSGAVKIIAMTLKKEIFLVGQWRYTINKFSWELPGGSVGKDQNSHKAAKIELKEEAGFQANNWKYLGAGYESVGAMHQKVKFYFATNLIKTIWRPEGSEKGIKVIKIPIQKAVRLILQNKIFDNSTIVGIFKAIEYLNKIRKI